MVAYFVRRLIGGSVSLIMTTLVLYTFCFVFPETFADQLNFGYECRIGASPAFYTRINYEMAEYRLDKPFPVNYLLWLFDPTGEIPESTDSDTLYARPYVEFSIASYHLSGSGLLTGDFGQSLQIQKGATVLNASALDLPGFFVSLFLPGIALVSLLRIGHKPHSHIPYRARVPMRTYLPGISGSRAL